MPGVDFNAVRSPVPMRTVLVLAGFAPRGASGDQLHGPCPVHGSKSARSRTFSVNLAEGLCKCHKCGFAGNQFQLWGKLTGLTNYAAAIDLCGKAGVVRTVDRTMVRTPGFAGKEQKRRGTILGLSGCSRLVRSNYAAFA